MSKVQAHTRSVRQLLTGGKFGIDFYQREYEWQRRHVEELLNDLEGRFFADFSPEHERYQVSDYQHYFLGTIITISESGKRFIVDGQQRLTTLTLLLIYVHHLRKEDPSVANVAPLIFSEIFNVKSFNIAVPEREDCMKALYERNTFDATEHADLSVRNLVERNDELEQLFSESLKGEVLPYFVDWLIECVDLVEIEAQTDDDAFTIFETMNDRGVNLGQADMLKGYLLANINSPNSAWMHDKKTQADKIWKLRIRELVDLGAGEEEDFFKAWLRAKYADTMRERKKGATNKDFEHIDKFHRWTRDNRERVGLESSDDSYDFITRNFDRYAGHYLAMQRTAREYETSHAEIYYNARNNFTLQYMLALAPVLLEDDNEIAREKIRMVTTFVDIYSARRTVNFKWNSYDTIRYAMFNLMKSIRDLTILQLRDFLFEYLHNMDETFVGITDGVYGQFGLHGKNHRAIRYLLERMTAWVMQQSKPDTDSNTYTGFQGKSFEIEHIWADKYERHRDEFEHENEFQRHRNFFGGLLLLPKGSNAAFGADPYEEKLQHYIEENLLAASLHSQKYKKNTDFRKFRERTRLPFKPHPHFKKSDIFECQELYRQICEQIWNPDRLFGNQLADI